MGKRIQHWVPLAAAVLGLVIAGCSVPAATTTTPTKTTPTTPALAKATKDFTAANGGTITLTTGASVTIPPNVLSRDTTVTVTELAGSGGSGITLDLGGAELANGQVCTVSLALPARAVRSTYTNQAGTSSVTLSATGTSTEQTTLSMVSSASGSAEVQVWSGGTFTATGQDATSVASSSIPNANAAAIMGNWFYQDKTMNGAPTDMKFNFSNESGTMHGDWYDYQGTDGYAPGTHYGYMYYTIDNYVFYGPYSSSEGDFYLMIPYFNKGDAALLNSNGQFEPYQQSEQSKDLFCFLEYSNGHLYWAGITPRPAAEFDTLNIHTMSEWADLFASNYIPTAFAGYDGTSL